MKVNSKYLVGIDEAGRGPLAGPVAVGVAVVPSNFDWQSKLPDVNDSKQLPEKKREEIFKMARRLKAAGQLNYAVSMVSAKVIDKVGIVTAINCGIEKSLKKISAYHTINRMIVKLDGGLIAPAEYKHQETIIKGDASEPIIGLASIMAKVTRDRYMTLQSSKPIFAPYNFATHKGYGTKAHREAISQYGLSTIHRISYCKNIKML